jgi:hypothetical protein
MKNHRQNDRLLLVIAVLLAIIAVAGCRAYGSNLFHKATLKDLATGRVKHENVRVRGIVTEIRMEGAGNDAYWIKLCDNKTLSKTLHRRALSARDNAAHSRRLRGSSQRSPAVSFLIQKQNLEKNPMEIFALFIVCSGITTGKLVLYLAIALAIGLFVGAQLTSHEERAHDYNLEDAELDEVHKLEAEASAEGKAVLAKLKGAAAELKQREQRVIAGLRGRS